MQLICLQIDLARQKETLSFMKSYADFAAENGYNALLVYLENAVRTEDTQYFSTETTYSQEEIQEFVSYATEKGLEVIPAFENLGHITMFASTRDILCLEDIRLSEMLTEQGIEHTFVLEEGLNHPYALFPIPEAKAARAVIVDAILGNY